MRRVVLIKLIIQGKRGFCPKIKEYVGEIEDWMESDENIAILQDQLKGVFSQPILGYRGPGKIDIEIVTSDRFSELLNLISDLTVYPIIKIRIEG